MKPFDTDPFSMSWLIFRVRVPVPLWFWALRAERFRRHRDLGLDT